MTTRTLSELVGGADSQQPAILAKGRPALTHGQLQGLMGRTVRRLNELGISRQDRVAMVLPQGPEMAAAFLGVAAGATAAPLNPAYREPEFHFYLEDLAPKAIILEKGQDSAARAVAAKRGLNIIELAVDLERGAGAFQLQGNPAALRGPGGFAEAGEVALVLHTSGTTSRPKMVPLTQANLCASARHIGATLQLGPEDRCLNVMPLFHIHGLIAAVLASLAAGGSVACVGPFDAGQFLGWLEHFAPTWYTAVPTMHQAILARAGRRVAAPLRFIRSSSAALPPAVMRDLEHCFGVPVVEAYGMTEAAHQMTSNPLPPRARKPGSVGLAAGPEVTILDEMGNPLAPGCTGEIAIRGPNVMPGYVENPAANAAAFTRGWFRTGDQGYLDADAYLFLTGRIKELINRAGEKIAPREIDEVLLAHPAVAQAVAFAIPDSQVGEEIGAAVVLQAGREVGETELQQFVASRLADFKVPRRVVFMTEIPKGATGKLQRVGLAEKLGVSAAAPPPDAPFVAPCTQTEMALAALWQEVLQLAPIGLGDHFFRKGGDSLRAARLAARIQHVFQADFPVALLYQNPTIATQAALLAHAARNHVAIACRAPSTGLPPLSCSQEWFWLLAQVAADPCGCHRAAHWRISGPLAAGALARALNEIVRRHEILRTTYELAGGVPVQRIHSPAPFALEEEDLAGLAPDLQADAVEARASRLLEQPMDLSRDYPWRFRLLRLAPAEHLLLAVFHHIAADGWSDGVFVAELRRLLAGQELEALPVQCADFALWQRQRLADSRRETTLAFWRQQVAQCPAALELPADFPRPDVPRQRGAREVLRFAPALQAALKSLAAQEDCTLFEVLLAGFQILLFRFTGQDDIVVGMPVAGRKLVETEPLLGCFTNTLAVRTQPEAGATVRQFLGCTRAAVHRALAHQEISFHEVVRDLALPRAPGRPLLVQVLFQLRNFPQPVALAATTPEFRRWHPALVPSPLEQEWEVEETAEGLVCACIYNTDLFSRATMQRLLACYELVLRGMVERPETALAELPLLLDADRHRLLVEWNDTAMEYPRQKCLHHLFEEQVERNPAAIAVEFGAQALTYRQLNERANLLARRLRALGAAPGVCVGLCLERGLDLIVGVLGILKSGGAYVPLDPGAPPARLQFMLQDVQAGLVVTQEKWRRLFTEGGVRQVCVDAMAEVSESAGNLNVAVAPTDLAYVLYTSGSTGQPKGVALEHRGPVALFHWVHQAFCPEVTARVLFSTSICFDLSVFEIFSALSSGGTVVMVENLFSLRQAPDLGITLINTVPSVLREFLRQSPLPASGHTLFLAGEALPTDLVRQACAEPGVRKVYDLYGPTETTVYSTVALRHPAEPETIGRPIANTRCYVLDARRNLVPPGVAGELYIGGDGLARGYLNRPALTAERFIPDPFSSCPGARLYRTGDGCRWRANGTLEYLGRLDDQVKIRGFRIELGEVEVALRKLPGVENAAAVVRRGSGPELVACLVPAAGSRLALAEVRQQLARWLPEYMMPGRFITVPRLPLNRNNKVDRRALAQMEGEPLVEAAAPTIPRNAVEAQLAAIWCAILNLPALGVHDHFFELGGDSLAAIRVAHEVSLRCGIEIPMVALFEAPTVAALAEYLARKQEAHVPTSG